MRSGRYKKQYVQWMLQPAEMKFREEKDRLVAKEI